MGGEVETTAKSEKEEEEEEDRYTDADGVSTNVSTDPPQTPGEGQGPAATTDEAEIKVIVGRVSPLVDGSDAEADEGGREAERAEGEALDFTVEKNGPPRHQHGDGGVSGAKIGEGGEGGESGVNASAPNAVADQSNPWLVKNIQKGAESAAPNEPDASYLPPLPDPDEPEGQGGEKGEGGEGGDGGGDGGGGGQAEGGLGAEATDELSSMPRSKRKVEMIISDEVEVDVWLGAISPHLVQYSSAFRDLGYDTTEFLLELDEEDRADLLKVRAFKLWNDRPCPS